MLQGNYEQILKLISESSNLPIDEVERKIEAKRAKLSGLISKEGAAQIIASELGISFDKHKIKISSLLPGMRRVNITGKIISINRVVEYNKNGKSGKIGSFILADETANVRVVLWDTSHISLIESKQIKENDVIEISGADIRNSEIHLSGFADIKLSQALIENAQTKISFHKKTIANTFINDNISLRAFIVQIFGPTFYNVCPECNKKVSELNECLSHGKVVPKKSAILNLILDDGTGTLRAVLFAEQIKKAFSINDFENSEEIMLKREDFFGKEILIEGTVRKNKISESLEVYVNNLQEINIEDLIKELDK